MSKKKEIEIGHPIHQPQTVLVNDPIYRLTSKVSIPVFWIIIVLIHLTVYIIVGITVDRLYPNATNLLGIHDWAEVINGVNVWVIFTPTAWAYYRWLPGSVLDGFRKIEELGIISSLHDNNNLSLSDMLQRGIDSKWIHILAVAATIVSFLYSFLIVIPAQEKALNGLIDFWYYTAGSRFFFFLLYLLQVKRHPC